MWITSLLTWPHNFSDIQIRYHFDALHVAIIRHESSSVYFADVILPSPLFLWVVVSASLKCKYVHFNFFYIFLSRQPCKGESQSHTMPGKESEGRWSVFKARENGVWAREIAPDFAVNLICMNIRAYLMLLPSFSAVTAGNDLVPLVAEHLWMWIFSTD